MPARTFVYAVELELERKTIEPTPPSRRPRRRSECVDGPRPCPWVSCRYHLYLEVARSGRLYTLHDREPHDLPETCALDVADAGPQTYVQIGRAIGSSRQLAEHLTRRAREKIARRGVSVEMLRLTGMHSPE